MTNYAAGTRFEHRVRDHLTANGYQVVRSAGSKTKIDLIALKPGQILLIQCKRNGQLPAAEWNALVTLAASLPGLVPVLAYAGPLGRGLHLSELTGPKVPRARTQPCRPFTVDTLEVV